MRYSHEFKQTQVWVKQICTRLYSWRFCLVRTRMREVSSIIFYDSAHPSHIVWNNLWTLECRSNLSCANTIQFITDASKPPILWISMWIFNAGFYGTFTMLRICKCPGQVFRLTLYIAWFFVIMKRVIKQVTGPTSEPIRGLINVTLCPPYIWEIARI